MGDSSRDFSPIWYEIEPPPDPEEVWLRWCGMPGCLFLDSALRDPRLGRYSFVMADPVAWHDAAEGVKQTWDWLTHWLGRTHTDAVPGLPPFQGGVAGLFGYDFGREFEAIPPPSHDEFGLPPSALGVYDVVAAFDHSTNRCWLISQGFPETDPRGRAERARERLAEFRERLLGPAPPHVERNNAPPLPLDELAPSWPVADQPGLRSNFDRDAYHCLVERAIEYIRAGDIFQVNLAQRLLCPARDDAVDLYRRLRKRNPAPFAAYFDLGDFQIASASPERFLCLRDGQVEARPIKGTRPILARPEADLFAGDDLRASAKDRAENVMIVDLLRNDLARVCRPESIRVPQLCEIETYQYVQHLVSVITGQLNAEAKVIDLLEATFPGGSITGAPKIRAMEIISELEPTARGAYCGGIGYFSADGGMDMNILIRTITAGRGWWQAPVGGGIVAASQPAPEYAETWHKAEGLLRAMIGDEAARR